MKKAILSTLFVCIGLAVSVAQTKRVLVFSKTAGFYHASIKEGRQFLLEWGKKNNVAVDTTTNAELFTDENLKRYNAVVFLNTTGDVLNPAQQVYFERFIQSGGVLCGYSRCFGYRI